MPQQYGLFGILLPLALAYVVVTLLLAIARGRVYGGIFWGTVHRGTAPGRYWFTLFCGLLMSVTFAALLMHIYGIEIYGIEPVAWMSGMIRRLLPA